MRLAIVNHLGDVGAGAEHSLLQFLVRLPASVEPVFFFFEDGAFAQSMRERFGSVTIVPMSARVASAKRDPLPFGAIPDSLSVAWRLTKALRAAAPDMVLTNSMKAHIIGSLAAKAAGLPCVNYVHDIVRGRALALLQVISRLCAVERLTCSNAVSASLNIAPSTAVYAPIEVARYKNLPDRTQALAALGLPDDGLPVVSLVGRIARWKGQDRFIRIALEILKETDAHFVIVGSPIFGCDAAYVPELHAAVAAAEAQQRIHFVSWQNDMRNIYGASDICANCSTAEPFGRTSLEALASGIPIVCFDDSGICEVFRQGQGGTHVPAGDEVAFAHAVRCYLTDSHLLATARVDAALTAEPLDIAKVYHTFAEVILRVSLSQGRAPRWDTVLGIPAPVVPK